MALSSHIVPLYIYIGIAYIWNTLYDEIVYARKNGKELNKVSAEEKFYYFLIKRIYIICTIPYVVCVYTKNWLIGGEMLKLCVFIYKVRSTAMSMLCIFCWQDKSHKSVCSRLSNETYSIELGMRITSNNINLISTLKFYWFL